MKSIIITGANEGIGYWMVNQWLEDGHKVVVLDLHTENLVELKEKFPDTFFYEQCDVTDAERVMECTTRAHKEMGGIDFAIHNACLCRFLGFNSRTCEDTRKEFEVNYFGAFHLLKAVIPVMRAQQAGHVFITSSGVGITGYTNISGYASTKGALESLVKCLRLEYGPEGIHFQLIHPPLTNTKSSEYLPVPKEFKASPEKVGRQIAKRVFKERFITTPSLVDALSVKMSYHMPLFTANLLDKATKRAAQQTGKPSQNGQKRKWRSQICKGNNEQIK